MFFVASYDIADDRRRRDVSDLLHAVGPRVQQSVFEIEVGGKAEMQSLMRAVRGSIDWEDDQVRFYRLPGPVLDREILGDRRLEERRRFYIV